MSTLLQTLLLKTFPSALDPVLLAYIEIVLPRVEQEFGMIPTSKKLWGYQFSQSEKISEGQQLIQGDKSSEQSLLTYILNSLLIIWNLLPFLNAKFSLSAEERRLLCLGFTFYGYKSRNQGKVASSTLTSDITLEDQCILNAFWAEWRDYLPAIVYLAEIPFYCSGKNIASTRLRTRKISEQRLQLPLSQLFSFGAIAAQLSSPADIVTTLEGDHLQALLGELGVNCVLTYHRLRSCTGLLTTSIHNAVLHLAEQQNWRPILFFAEGVVYLAPSGGQFPDRVNFQKFVWEQVSNRLSSQMLMGAVGCKRDGKGLKVAPQTHELLSPAQLIKNLPRVIVATIRNVTDPATPKRLERLNLNPTEREFLAHGADLRSDRIAEFIIFLQKEFFGYSPEFIIQVLTQLGIQTVITSEQTQIFSGGVNWGWYHAAAYYVASNPDLDLNGVTVKLQELANQLLIWAEKKNLLPTQTSSTHEVFDRYLTQYLELPGWENPEPSFQYELATYVVAKTKAARQPICSLSSGEFASEEQMDSVVLFKPQQYSNKNSLGGRRLKRGISKLWSLEMLLRQACWSVSAGKLEEQQPVFLYLFPGFVHAPQITTAIRMLFNQLKGVNLWEIRRFWQKHGMDAQALRFYPWLRANPNPADEDNQDLPFLAITYTTTSGKTSTDAWVEPAFLAIALPLVLGIKVVATASLVPLYDRGGELPATVQMDGPASFWNLLGLPTSIPLEAVIQGQIKHLHDWLDRLLIAYSIHLDCRADPPDPRWQLFAGTVQAITSDASAIFSLAHSHFSSLSDDKVRQYWQFAQVWAAGDSTMEHQLELTQRLVCEYYTFYRVRVTKSTHALVLPLSKVLEDILATPSDLPIETLILQTSGRLHDALKRQEPFKRPLIMDQSLSSEIRANNEIQAIHRFVTTCIKDLFLGQYKGDRALLQEHRNRIKSGAEFAYRLLAMQEPKPETKKQDVEGAPV